MSQQQTVLRVQTTQPSDITITGATALDVIDYTTGVTYGGAGTFASPYTGTTALNSGEQSIDFEVIGNGTFYYDVTVPFPVKDSSPITILKALPLTINEAPASAVIVPTVEFIESPTTISEVLPSAVIE